LFALSSLHGELGVLMSYKLLVIDK